MQGFAEWIGRGLEPWVDARHAPHLVMAYAGGPGILYKQEGITDLLSMFIHENMHSQASS